MRQLAVACTIDRRIVYEIASGRRTTNAKYDGSVIEALRRLYRKVDVVRAHVHTTHTLEELRRIRPDVVFNLAFSATSFEAPFAGALALLGVPFTGSRAGAIALANDKIRSRILLGAVGIRVPRFATLEPWTPIEIDFPPPYIVKPAALAASAGINADSVVTSEAPVRALASRIWERYRQPALCEEFIVGRELRAAVVEDGSGTPRVAGTSEWVFRDCEPGWGFKTRAIRAKHRVRDARNVSRGLVRLPPSLNRQLHRTVRDCMRVLGISGYATIDMRVDRDGQLHVLEVNANPGLWSGAAVWSRPSFETNIRRIVATALRGEPW